MKTASPSPLLGLERVILPVSKEMPMSCSGPCNQGKKPCPTPTACQTPSDEAPSNGLFYFFVAVILVWIIAVVVAPAVAGYIVGAVR